MEAIYSMKSCCFTGHRMLKIDEALEQRLTRELCRLIDMGVTDFYAGGARGWDTFSAFRLLELRRTHPEVKLHLILPCSPEEQCRDFSMEELFFYNSVLHSADSVEQISDEYFDGCTRVRNKRMVELADICLCCYDTRRFASGTGQTVRMAEQKGIPIINLYEV